MVRDRFTDTEKQINESLDGDKVRFGYSKELRNELAKLMEDAPHPFTYKNVLKLLDLEKKMTEFNAVRGENVPTTYNHSVRVAGIAAEIARAASLDEDQVALVTKAALLHDVGKIMIPEFHLYKQGKFNEKEKTIMDSHAEWSGRILKDFFGDNLPEEVLHAATEHHKDVTGLIDDIIRYADQIEAITSTERTYKSGKSLAQAQMWLKNISPEIIELGNEIMERHRDNLDIDRNGNFDMSMFDTALQSLITDKSLKTEEEKANIPGSSEIHMRKCISEIQAAITKACDEIGEAKESNVVKKIEKATVKLREELSKYPWEEIIFAVKQPTIALEYPRTENTYKPFKAIYLDGGKDNKNYPVVQEILFRRNISAICLEQPYQNLMKAENETTREAAGLRQEYYQKKHFDFKSLCADAKARSESNREKHANNKQDKMAAMAR